MKITQKISLSPTRIAAFLIGMFLVVLCFVTLELTGIVNVLNLDGKTPEETLEIKTNADTKRDFIENTDSEGKPDSNQEETTKQPSSSAYLDLNAKQENNGSVTVLTKLYGYSNGECKLEITNGSKSFTQSAEVIYQPEFSTCAGFSVRKESVGSGKWNIELTVTSNDAPSSKAMTLEVAQ